MFDWDATVLAANFEIFGELFTYAPARAGASSFTINAIFDAGFTSVEIDSGQSMSSVRPRLGVQISQFTVFGQTLLGNTPPPADYSAPLQGDYVRRELDQRLYRVKEVQPDSHGHVHLELNAIATNNELAVAEARFV